MRIHAVFFWFVVAVVALASARAADSAAIFVLIGDQHSAYARTAQFVAAVERLKQDHPGVPLAVLIDGDLFERGNVVAERSGGEIEFAMVAALTRLAPTIVNVGNHDAEFHSMQETVQRLRAAGATVVSNIVDLDSGALVASPSVELALGRETAVVVGLGVHLLAQYPAAVRTTIEVPNPRAWARTQLVERLAMAPVRIVLSHAGLASDREILPLVPDGTLYVGAHDHVRLVHRDGRTVYVHSGAWNNGMTVARLQRDADKSSWVIEPQLLSDTDTADPKLTALIQELRTRHLRPEDLAPVAQLLAALPRESAAQRVVRAVREASGADAAFIGNTTFGDGLPAGVVRKVDLDACVRFDSTIWIADVTGEQLRRWLAAANPRADTPLAERRNEVLFADAAGEVVPERRYRIATTDWGARNRARYFGDETLVFVELPELRLKAIVAKALNVP